MPHIFSTQLRAIFSNHHKYPAPLFLPCVITESVLISRTALSGAAQLLLDITVNEKISALMPAGSSFTGRYLIHDGNVFTGIVLT